MIRSVVIKNFRGIRSGELSGFTPIVVLVGPNNSGKSTVIDALMLAASGNINQAYAQVTANRAGPGQPHLWLLFRNQGKEELEAEIVIRGDSPEGRQLKIGHSGGHPSNPLQFSTTMLVGQNPTTAINSNIFGGSAPVLKDVADIILVSAHGQTANLSLTDLYSAVSQRGLKNEAKAIIKDLLPDLEDIEILTENGQGVIFFNYKKSGTLPLSIAGDGVRLLFQQTYRMASIAGGTVLLEEPETHMHPGGIRQICRSMIATMKRGVQIILTTHSLDVIDSLLSEVDSGWINNISLFRLKLKDGELVSYRLSGKEASLGRTQIGDDLR